MTLNARPVFVVHHEQHRFAASNRVGGPRKILSSLAE